MKSELKMLVFNHRRPLQLDATLRSFKKHCRRHGDLSVYDADCSTLEPGVFKREILKELIGYKYVLFCVDDTLFIRDFNLTEVTNTLEADSELIGFSLRLGLNTKYCYMHDKPQKLPQRKSRNDVMFCKWSGAQEDFGYPLEISSSVYRVKDIWRIMMYGKFDTPTRLEILLHKNRHKVGKNLLAFFKKSVAFSAPFNKVQTVSPNNRCGGHTAEEFQKLYDAGKRMDIDMYSGIIPNAVHMEVPLHLEGG